MTMAVGKMQCTVGEIQFFHSSVGVFCKHGNRNSLRQEQQVQTRTIWSSWEWQNRWKKRCIQPRPRGRAMHCSYTAVRHEARREAQQKLPPKRQEPQPILFRRERQKAGLMLQREDEVAANSQTLRQQIARCTSGGHNRAAARRHRGSGANRGRIITAAAKKWQRKCWRELQNSNVTGKQTTAHELLHSTHTIQ